MVIDTSALVAILLREKEAFELAQRLAASPIRLLSAVNRIEPSFVLEGRKGEAGRQDLELLLDEAAIDVVAVTRQRPTCRQPQYRRLLRLRPGESQ